MSLLTQIAAVTAMNLRSIPRRLGNSLVIVIGVAGVVAVLISVLAMSLGFRATVKGDARADRAIVLRVMRQQNTAAVFLGKMSLQ